MWVNGAILVPFVIIIIIIIVVYGMESWCFRSKNCFSPFYIE